MRLLLDSHIILWWLGGEDLSSAAAEAIASPDNDAYYSAASTWEFSIKESAGKLHVDWARLEELLKSNGFIPLSIAPRHGMAAGQLPRHHGDPFDRMLIAQAIDEDLTIVTHDRKFAAYDVTILWS